MGMYAELNSLSKITTPDWDDNLLIVPFVVNQLCVKIGYHDYISVMWQWIYFGVKLQLSNSKKTYICLSVRPSHLFHNVPAIVSSLHFREMLPMTKVQNVKFGGRSSRSQRSKPNVAVSGP